MNEQERIEAMRRQRKLAQQKARNVDGSFETERRIELERRRRAENRRQQQIKAMKQKIYMAMLVLLLIIVVMVVFVVKSCTTNEHKRDNMTDLASTELQTEELTSEKESDTEKEDETQTENVELPQTSTATEITSMTPVVATVEVEAPVEVQRVIDQSGIVIPNWITVDLIHINSVSRPAVALDAVNDIAIHYVANPGSSAKANRDYFDSLDDPRVEGAGRQASAHLIVGLEGEVVQCLPLNELAYAVRSRNPDTISIEVCHPDATGKFSDVTYNTLVKLTAWLLQQNNLTPDHVIRHFDCDGKSCPLYYVENEDAWNRLKQDIADYYYANPNIQ